MTILNRWRVIITATQAEDYVWRDEDEGEPTVGSGGEPIDTAKSRIVRTVEDNVVEILEEVNKTGGHFKFESITVSCPANQVTTHQISYPYDINVKSARIITAPENRDDVLSWVVAPDTTVGTLTVDASIGATVLDVSQTVVDNIHVGFKVKLVDGVTPTTNEDLGYVLNVDKTNLQITVQTATTLAWAAATPTLVQMTVWFVENMVIGPENKIAIGSDTLKSSYLPANTPLYCNYDNKSPSTAKTFYAYIQYLY